MIYSHTGNWNAHWRKTFAGRICHLLLNLFSLTLMLHVEAAMGWDMDTYMSYVHLLCYCPYISANLSTSLLGILLWGRHKWKKSSCKIAERIEKWEKSSCRDPLERAQIKSQHNFLLLWHIFLLPSCTYSLFSWAALTQCLILFHNLTWCEVVTQLPLWHGNFCFLKNNLTLERWNYITVHFGLIYKYPSKTQNWNQSPFFHP